MRPKQKGTAAPKTGAAVPLLLFCFILLLSGSAAGYPTRALRPSRTATTP